MSNLGVNTVILGEDRAHQIFVYRTLLKLGCHRRDLHIRPSPVGRGAGEQWVRREYPVEVAAHRQKVHHRKSGLFAIIDADRHSVSHRQNQLGDALAAHGLQARNQHEPIVHFIPKRNIETWIVHLLGNEVDELTDYKSSAKGADLKLVADRYLERYRNPEPERSPESLTYSFEELRRFPPD